MTTHLQPRHARAEIRDFAAWMESRGWTFERTDNKGHTIWALHGAVYKLPHTPKRFNVRRSRAVVLRLEGVDPARAEGKRNAARLKDRSKARRAQEQTQRAPEFTQRHRPTVAVAVDLAAVVTARAEAEQEISDLREACEYAQAALRKYPHSPETRAHFERLRHTYAEALAGR